LYLLPVEQYNSAAGAIREEITHAAAWVGRRDERPAAAHKMKSFYSLSAINRTASHAEETLTPSCSWPSLVPQLPSRVSRGWLVALANRTPRGASDPESLNN